MKPLVCPCGRPLPENPEPVGMKLGGYVEVRCACGLYLQIPWGRVPLQQIEKARETLREASG